MGPGTKHLFSSLVIILGLSEVFPQDPCYTYDEMPVDERRLPTYREPNPDNRQCDILLRAGWFRFTGGIGTDLFNNTVSVNHCGTDNPLWMTDSIPTPSDGVVSRTVCMTTAFSSCHTTLNIQVKNCCSYRVYYLTPPGLCASAYCVDSHIKDDLCESTSTTAADTSTTLDLTTSSTRTSIGRVSIAYLLII